MLPRRNTIVRGKTREKLFQNTKRRTRFLREAVYEVVEVWSCQDRCDEQKPRTFTKTFPHAILYDFKAFDDKNQRKELTGTLTL